ncbi:carboxymuconolactone decarboxylase family protein [Salipiger mucosus]|uniref:Putative 4-carboxymuconolactone decarboxylase n=1 Tax=Salipiger mucosus DSM 16094 TaxID=1123237 RepID=S9QJ96_9RHOB|nr:carboxymuconolactone decarboxylase family protein [Salipiger mucosus]EPX79623.1 Putative 4-carboxymuconolactone decarboxylase [Salipiger mucosus DSM 16094]
MSFKDDLARNATHMRELRKAMPDTFAGFMSLEKAASADNALSAKQKEFVALGISVAIRCEGCILAHVKALIRQGASREELVDVLGTAVQMAGGPGLSYASKALAAFDELTAGA